MSGLWLGILIITIFMVIYSWFESGHDRTLELQRSRLKKISGYTKKSDEISQILKESAELERKWHKQDAITKGVVVIGVVLLILRILYLSYSHEHWSYFLYAGIIFSIWAGLLRAFFFDLFLNIRRWKFKNLLYVGKHDLLSENPIWHWILEIIGFLVILTIVFFLSK